MIRYSEVYNALPTIFYNKIHRKALFHYTSITGFLLMMKDITKKRCFLFPGHMRYQNDAQELSEGISFIENDFKTNNAKTETQIAETIKNLNNNIYISCFSSDRDLLEQWKYYGSNCGLSIEFDFEQCEGFFDEKSINGEATRLYEYASKEKCINDNPSKDDIFGFDNPDLVDITMTTYGVTRGGLSLNPIDVLYSHDDKSHVLSDIIENNCEANMSNLSLMYTESNIKQYINCAVSSFIPICKNHYFSHEQESRLLFFQPAEAEIMYREKNNRILPYLKCIVVNKDINKYPIVSVTVGPGSNQHLIFNAVINMLEGNDNQQFISMSLCDAILNDNDNTYKDEITLREKIEPNELRSYYNDHKEKIIVYCCSNGILVYKSSIPFRD